MIMMIFKAINSNQNYIKSIDFMMVYDEKLIPIIFYEYPTFN